VSGVTVSITEHVVAYHIYLIQANREVDRNGEENKQIEGELNKKQRRVLKRGG
jgi:hypothetical protein